MSASRRHTDVVELGWADFYAACTHDPIARVQGRLPNGKRFNRALRVLTLKSGITPGGPTVEAARVKWWSKGGIWIDTGETMLLEWKYVDWVTWKARNDPNGTWMKVTAKGRSNFGHFEVRGNSVVDTRDRSVVHHVNRGLAVIAAGRLAQAT